MGPGNLNYQATGTTTTPSSSHTAFLCLNETATSMNLNLLQDLRTVPELRNQFIAETGTSKARLDEAVKDGDLGLIVCYLQDRHTVFYYATENGSTRVICWRGYYFSESEWDELAGPFSSLEEALEPIRYLLECGDENDTDSASHSVESKLGDMETFKVIAKLVSIDDVVEVNGVMYRRTESGYVKE